MVKTGTIKFRLGEKFMEKTMDDRAVDTVFTLDIDNADGVDDDAGGEGGTKKKRKLVQSQVDKVS